MNLINAIQELRHNGAVEYRPMGAQMGCNNILFATDEAIRIPSWNDMSELTFRKAVKSFYEDNADYFADGYWLVMRDDSGDLIMEVCDEA